MPKTRIACDNREGAPAAEWEALPTDLSPTIRKYLTRCLEKDPKRRVRDIGVELEASIALVLGKWYASRHLGLAPRGEALSPGSKLICRGLPPMAGTVYTPQVRFLWEKNAMCRPSGDQLG